MKTRSQTVSAACTVPAAANGRTAIDENEDQA